MSPHPPPGVKERTVGVNRHHNAEGERINREEVLAMVVWFSEIMVHVRDVVFLLQYRW